ncbi:hypothetical protein [Clostridium peptidivorans]|uniref:hypothetical protein n=1 Tax=Clostridium peptidivorans TaxID=100174 RepID=UPI000BE32BF5|nr:hypothetical protein [Clostridium peptidivorans]
MIDKEIFKKIEGRLYRYYKDMSEIDKLEYRCMVLEKAKEQLREDIRNTNISIETELNMGISYEERVQSSSSGSSYAEQETIRQVEKLEQEWKNTRRQILKAHARIREIKNKNADMNYIIKLLGSKYKLIAEMKYKDELSLDQIGNRLHMDKSTVSRNRERIVMDVSKLITL